MRIPAIVFTAILLNGNHVKIMVYKQLTRVDVDLLSDNNFDENVDLTKEDALIKLKASLKKATMLDDEVTETIKVIKSMACVSVLKNLEEN